MVINSETIQRQLVPIALAIPVASLATGDFIIAVNVQWGWKSATDAAPVSIPLFVFLWAGMSWLAIAAEDVKKGALRLTGAFIAFSLCLSIAMFVQNAANPISDPIFPPILILTAATIIFVVPMVLAGLFVRQSIASEIKRDEYGLPAPDDWAKKRRVAALLLLLGIFGIHGLHRFYVGKSVMGLLMLVTFGGLFIWALVDLVAMLRGRFTDCYGVPLSTAKSDVVVILVVFAVPFVLIGACYLF